MKKYLLFVFIGVFIGAVGLWAYINQSVQVPVVPSDLSSYEFTVNEGETQLQVLNRLEEAGFLKNSWTIKAYQKLHPSRIKGLQAGNYKLAPGLSVIEVLSTFTNGQFPIRLVFIEGWRREEYASYLIKAMGQDFAADFYDLTENQEGYLFPDTYFIDENSSAQELLDKMLANYHEKTQIIDAVNGFATNLLSESEGITMASIVEREVTDLADRAIVAGILIKRLKNSWPIEADATVQYAISDQKISNRDVWDLIGNNEFIWWPKDLTFEDLKIESPFNTRLNRGLPPAPISNPGAQAIEAVAKPIDSNYWYYISDRDGVTRYAETLDEHNKNIQQFGLAQ